MGRITSVTFFRTKSERGKRDFMEELEALKQELMESQDKTQANMELRTEREKQYISIKVLSFTWIKSFILSEKRIYEI